VRGLLSDDRRGGRGYTLEFQDGRDPLQQGGARQCRESIGDRQGSCEIGDASVLDESERQVFGVVEVIQDLVVRGTDFVTS
jgi:hypothetical protein